MKIGSKSKKELKEGKGTKDDHNKPDYLDIFKLLDWNFLKDTAKVLRKGLEKYAFENWKKDLDPERIQKALIRHTLSLTRGEFIDKESKLPHVCHITANCMFLHFYHYRSKKC